MFLILKLTFCRMSSEPGGETSLQNSRRCYWVPCNKLIYFSLTAHESKALLVRGGVDAEWHYSGISMNGRLSTTATATNAFPQLSPTAKITSRQWPVFSATDENVRNVHKWILMARLWSIAAILFWFFFHLYGYSEQKLSAIPIVNVAYLDLFVTLVFWFKG